MSATKPHHHDDPERTKPMGLIRYANDFYKAAIGADDTFGMRPGYEIIAPIPVYYLIGHSMELALKAYLLHNGVTLHELRSNRHFGHDIVKCFEKATEFGLLKIVTFNDNELGTFTILNNLYSNKELEYIVVGYKEFPMFGPLQTMSRKLIDAIAPAVGYSNWKGANA